MRTEEWQEKAAFIDKLRELTDRLNRCRAAYEAHTPLVSDEVYDILFSDLQILESGFLLPFLSFHLLLGAQWPKFSSLITDRMVSSSSQSAENAVGA